MVDDKKKDRAPGISGPPVDPPESRPSGPEPGVMVRCPFNPDQRRQQMVSRLLELRSVIPQLEEEKMRLEGSISLLNEISPPNPMGLPMVEGTEDLDGDDGPNGKPGRD